MKALCVLPFLAINLGLLLRRPLFSVACAIASDFYYGVPELACAITLGLLLRRL